MNGSFRMVWYIVIPNIYSQYRGEDLFQNDLFTKQTGPLFSQHSEGQRVEIQVEIENSEMSLLVKSTCCTRLTALSLIPRTHSERKSGLPKVAL